MVKSLLTATSTIPLHFILVSPFLSSVVLLGVIGVKRNIASEVFTDLSGLATCDYGLTFNRPIKLFMERVLTCLYSALSL